MKVNIHYLKTAAARELSLHALLFKNRIDKISSKNGDSLLKMEYTLEFYRRKNTKV